MMGKSACLLLLICGCTHSLRGYSQSPSPDSAFYRSLQSNVEKLYSSRIGAGSVLYSGGEYLASFSGNTGYRFFIYPNLTNGTIYYDDVLYHDVPLAYDMVSNEVITKGYLGFSIRLHTEKINYFSIADHLFIRIAGDSVLNDPPAGFYEVLYNGSWQVLAGRSKEIVKSVKQDEGSRIVQHNVYFARKENAWHIINDKNSLMALFGSDISKANDFYNANNLDYKKQTESTIVKLVTWYDQSKN